MITITYVTASHPNNVDFEKHAMSDAGAPRFVAEMAKLQDKDVNCTIVNECVLMAFRAAVAREEIHHEKICLIYSSAKGEERCRFSPYGVVLAMNDKPRYPAAHGVTDPTIEVIEAAAQRKKRELQKEADY